MAPRLIGLTGKAGSGKDTAAGFIRNYLGAGCMTIAFAKPIKDALAAMGFPEPTDRSAKEAKVKGFDFTWRQLAQTLGTEWGRQQDSDLWLKLAMQKVDHYRKSMDFVLTDVRFENEAAAIRNRGGEIWHITGRQGVLVGCTGAHTSESGVMLHQNDKVIDNRGSMLDLEDSILRALEVYGG